MFEGQVEVAKLLARDGADINSEDQRRRAQKWWASGKQISQANTQGSYHMKKQISGNALRYMGQSS